MANPNFADKYAEKFGMQTWCDTKDKNEKPVDVLKKLMNKNQSNSKVTIYYFHTDLKFILKARLWQLEQQLKQETSQQNKAEKLMCDNRDKSGQELCNEKTYTMLEASNQQFNCNHCGPGKLEQINEENGLGE